VIPVLLFAVAATLSARIDHRVQEYADRNLFDGVVLVSQGDEILYEKAFGLADRTFLIRNTPSTKFHIASVSKPITAAAVLLLADHGKLALTDPVSKFVLDFPNGEHITIEQLLTHYSGLADTSSRPEYDEWSRFPQTPASLEQRLAKLPPRSNPDTKFSYSNSNYHLLALIIEKASGRSYGDFLDANIFKPLGMSATAHHGADSAIVTNLATGYMPEGSDGFAKPPYFDWTAKTGNGSLYTTARDLLRFHHALQRGGLLKPQTVEQSYGFGLKDRQVGMFWFRREQYGHRSVYVGGSSPGFKAYIERFIDDDLAVIVLANTYIASTTPLADDIRAILWQKDPVLPPLPARVAVSPEQLDRVTGDYQYGPDFYAPNARFRMERRDGYLVSISSTGQSLPIVPIGGDVYFDRAYWSFIRFADGKMTYRNGSDEFVALRVK
jgi:CubicO group peptidase (beta-lactamase class C family)